MSYERACSLFVELTHSVAGVRQHGKKAQRVQALVAILWQTIKKNCIGLIRPRNVDNSLIHEVKCFDLSLKVIVNCICIIFCKNSAKFIMFL